MVNSKHKGNTHERWTADKLSEWWGEEFKRIPSSGALRWHGSTDTYGDLLVPPSFPGLVECKHNKQFDLLGCLTQKPTKSNLLGWWDQAYGDSVRATKETGGTWRHPFLVAKGNRTTPVICVESTLAGWLPKLSNIQVVGEKSFTIYTLETFLKSVAKGQLLEASQLSRSLADLGLGDTGGKRLDTTTRERRGSRSCGSSAGVRTPEGLGRLPAANPD